MVLQRHPAAAALRPSHAAACASAPSGPCKTRPGARTGRTHITCTAHASARARPRHRRHPHHPRYPRAAAASEVWGWPHGRRASLCRPRPELGRDGTPRAHSPPSTAACSRPLARLLRASGRVRLRRGDPGTRSTEVRDRVAGRLRRRAARPRDSHLLRRPRALSAAPPSSTAKGSPALIDASDGRDCLALVLVECEIVHRAVVELHLSVVVW